MAYLSVITYLLDKKIILVVILLGAQTAPAWGMQLFGHAVKTMAKKPCQAWSQAGRLLSSSRQNPVSPESVLASQKQYKEKLAYLALSDALMHCSGAQRWVAVCAKTFIDLEFRYCGQITCDDKTKPDAIMPDIVREALTCAHKDVQQAGINLRKAELRVAQAEQELAAIRTQLQATQVTENSF